MTSAQKKRSNSLPIMRPIDLVQSRLAARVWSETVSDEWRINQAALFAREAMRAFAGKAVPHAKLRDHFVLPAGRLDPEAAELACSIGLGASALPLVNAMHYLTSLYAALLPSVHRGNLGAFYTPPPLSSRLLDLADEYGLNWRSARVLDPAAGGGAFLLQCALRMRQTLIGSEPAFALAQIGNRLLGLEVDPYAASLAQASLDILLADLAEKSGHKVPIMVRVCDTLSEQPNAKFDLVVGNPPYGRVTLTADNREKFKRSLYGHANLYGVFTDIAVRWAKPGGLISYLTPTSMLGGQYYAALRELLATTAPPIAIDFVHARKDVFEDVLQETLLALYRKGPATQRRVQVHYLHVRNENEAEVSRNGTIALPKNPAQPWLAPRDPKHSALIAYAEKMHDRLSDWGYEVSTGPLVWNRFKPQLHDKPGKNRFPLIWAEAVTAKGQFIFRAEKRNHAPYFELKATDSWLRVDKECVLVQRTTAKEQARRLIAAELSAAFIKKHRGVVIENHLNMVRRKKKARVSTAAVAAILNSDVVDQVFRCISGSVAVSAFELEALPLPPIEQMKRIERMLEEGATHASVEKAIEKLYGQERTS